MSARMLFQFSNMRPKTVFRNHPRRFKSFFLLIISTVILMGATKPEKTNPDDALPLTIESDTFEYSNKTGIAIYQGHVISEQGTRHLTADKLVVYKTAEGEVSKMFAYGNPAKFRLKPEINKPLLLGEGKTIEFYNISEQLYLINNAKLTQNGDTYKAPRIEYDIAKERVKSPENQLGRTVIILKSQKNKG